MTIPKRHKQEVDGTDAWLMSYADMITLLLCFFIIFVSVSEPKKDKISQIAEGMNGRFGSVDYANPFTGVVRQLQQVIETQEMYRDAAVDMSDTAIKLELASNAFFKPSSPEFNDTAFASLDAMIGALKTVDVSQYKIVVEAHTSDEPPVSGLYPTNWDLSAAQAAKVVRLLIQKGFAPGSVVAEAYGDSKPKVPNLDTNGTPIPGNRSKNQRIVIAIQRN
jgi:chemotaxis protein MotB